MVTRFRSAGSSCIVVTICSTPASSASAARTTARGSPVLPDVTLSNATPAGIATVPLSRGRRRGPAAGPPRPRVQHGDRPGVPAQLVTSAGAATSWSTGMGTRSRPKHARIAAKNPVPFATRTARIVPGRSRPAAVRPPRPRGRDRRARPTAGGRCQSMARAPARAGAPGVRGGQGAAGTDGAGVGGLRHGTPCSTIQRGRMERELSGKRALVTGASRASGWRSRVASRPMARCHELRTLARGLEAAVAGVEGRLRFADVGRGRGRWHDGDREARARRNRHPSEQRGNHARFFGHAHAPGGGARCCGSTSTAPSTARARHLGDDRAARRTDRQRGVAGPPSSEPGAANYAAAKGALVAFTKSLAAEAGRYGITVNALCPGYVETDIIAHMKPEERAGTRRAHPA